MATIQVVEGVLSANDAIAQANREQFNRAGTYAINMMSSPGAGKTTVLERTFERLAGQVDRDERRRAGRVDRQARTFEIVKVGKPIGRNTQCAAGVRIRIYR